MMIQGIEAGLLSLLRDKLHGILSRTGIGGLVQR